MKSYSILYSCKSYTDVALTFEQIFSELGCHHTERFEVADILIVMDREILDSIISNINISSNIILFIFKSDILQYWDIDISRIDHIIIGVDTQLKILFPWRNLCDEIIPIQPLITTNSKNTLSGNRTIFVNLEEKQYPNLVLPKVIRFLNKLVDRHIIVVSKSLPSSVFNDNILIIQPTEDLDYYIQSATIIVGAGYTALKGISLGKKVIVIGERGYGGIPTINNLDLFYNEFFQGAIGGRLDGPIPESLFFEDIQNLLPANSTELRLRLASLQQRFRDKIINIIKQTICLDKNSERTYIFNSDYTIIKSTNDYWLLNRYTRLLIAKLNPSLASKLLAVYNGASSLIFSTDERQSLINQKVLI